MTQWTSNPPREPGWYWWRSERGLDVITWAPEVVEVWIDDRNGGLLRLDPRSAEHHRWKSIPVGLGGGEWWPIKVRPPP